MPRAAQRLYPRQLAVEEGHAAAVVVETQAEGRLAVDFVEFLLRRVEQIPRRHDGVRARDGGEPPLRRLRSARVELRPAVDRAGPAPRRVRKERAAPAAKVRDALAVVYPKDAEGELGERLGGRVLVDGENLRLRRRYELPRLLRADVVEHILRAARAPHHHLKQLFLTVLVLHLF